MARLKVFLVGGARPNFMKVAPLYRAAEGREGLDCRIVHTGQHSDPVMSGGFFEEFGLPEPHHYLGEGSGTHAVQTARIMIGFESLCVRERPDLVMVVGDVDSTLACALSAAKLGLDVANVEAGLRSFDRGMPEEINRVVTDALADHLFASEESAVENLLREGRPLSSIHLSGNVMVDNLLHQLALLEAEDESRFSTFAFKRENPRYVFLTLHRPSNVDDRTRFVEILSALNPIAQVRPILFPVHPRTRKMMDVFGLALHHDIILLPPLSFRESLYLWKDAECVLTDSGGLQEETTALGVPCVTLRENTERPATVTHGTNILGGTSRERILSAFTKSVAARSARPSPPPFWDGRAAERIWDLLA